MLFAEILILIALIWAAAFYQTPAKIWTPVIAIALLLMTFWGGFYWPVMAVFWIIFLIPAILFNVAWIRTRFITPALLKYFQKNLPSISPTEREVLEAGDVMVGARTFLRTP